MCFQGIIAFSCGHEGIEETVCAEAAEAADHITFFHAFLCPSWTTERIGSPWQCGLGKLYCGATERGRQFDRTLRVGDAACADLARLEEQIQVVHSAAQARIAAMSRSWDDHAQDPQVMHLCKIGQAHIEEKQDLVEVVQNAREALNEAEMHKLIPFQPSRRLSWWHAQTDRDSEHAQGLNRGASNLHRGNSAFVEGSINHPRTVHQEPVHHADPSPSREHRIRSRPTANKGPPPGSTGSTENAPTGVRRSQRVRGAKKVNYYEASSNPSRTPSPARSEAASRYTTISASPQRTEASPAPTHRAENVPGSRRLVQPWDGVLREQSSSLHSMIGEWQHQHQTPSSSPSPSQSPAHSPPHSSPDAWTPIHAHGDGSPHAGLQEMSGRSYEDMRKSIAAAPHNLPTPQRDALAMPDPCKRSIDSPVVPPLGKRARLSLMVDLTAIKDASPTDRPESIDSSTTLIPDNGGAPSVEEQDVADDRSSSLSSVDWVLLNDEFAGDMQPEFKTRHSHQRIR